jgi:hypothetical protein
MGRDVRAPARPPFGTSQTRPEAASGAGHRAASAAAVTHQVNCHRNPHRNPQGELAGLVKDDYEAARNGWGSGHSPNTAVWVTSPLSSRHTWSW